ncbi:hypothetical protein jhhlp_006599 [Lomentospora prolificans]|uniref:SAC3/GANP/THP3 conserved domain-containing protein n=1 Tax=Lomentospora prolificans TaxID=41688 RepID=A0A2N3N6E9_9PEZI|nr:hypothetical protein jhhlp_006599 [Lomentospora prolificans]
MATFGGSGWPAATETQSASPFGGGAFALTSKPSPFASNPFGSQSATPATQGNGNSTPRNPFAAASGSTSSPQLNPFAAASTTKAPAVKNPFQSQTPSPSIFSAKNTGTFGATSQPQANRSPSPFSMPSNQGRPNSALNAQANTFAPATTNLNGGKTTFGTQFGARKPFGAASDAEQSDDSKRSKRKKGDAGGFEIKKKGAKNGTRSSSFGAQDAQKNGHGPRGALLDGPSGHGKRVHFDQAPNGPSRNVKQANAEGLNRRNHPPSMKSKSRPVPNPVTTNDPYAKKILAQLSKDGIHPPEWPADPGNPSNKHVMMQFREDYKEYREKARASLIRAGLIDDPDDRKRLEDAIDFKGICENMCPEFEKVTRITEFDVKQAEKDPATSWADTSKMVKKLARSAAGQEAPLPMDVRSVAALRRTLDYLIDDLLEYDDNLPVVHGFLWDRTRAIRRDFAFFSSMNPDEMRDQVYCLETIARFHVTSLHLLAQKDFTYEDFSEQQEVEQLGKTLISLMYAYNDCNAQGITCPNEAEFRAYQLVFRAFHPDVLENVQREWDPKFWRESDDIRTAVSLVEALQNTQDFHGPLKGAPSYAAASAYNSFFRIVEDPSVSFTMACFAEIHFGQLRRSILSAVKKAFSRPKQTPKDITAAVLNSYLRFDTVDEAVEFAEIHGLEFARDESDPENLDKSYLILEYGRSLEYPRLHHTYSDSLVEKKRNSHSLPDVIHHTSYEDPSAASKATRNDEDSLFVPSTSSEPLMKQTTFTPSPAPAATASPFAPAASPATSISSFATTKPTSPFSQAPQQTPSALSAFQSDASALASSSNVSLQPPTFTTPGALPNAGTNLGLASSQQPAASAQKAVTPTPPPAFSFKPASEPKPPGQPATTIGSINPAPTLSSSLSTGGGKPASPFDFLSPTAAKPVGTASPSIKVTPPTPAFPPPQQSTAAQPTGAAPTTSIQQSPPTGSASIGSIPKVPESPATNTTPSTQAPTRPSLFAPVAAPQVTTIQAPTKEENWDSFTKWFVIGDTGLMEQFQMFVVEEAVRKAYEQYIQEEEERIRKEEDEKSWAEARKFRTYSLGVKYFYRWRETARQNRASALRRSARDQLRTYQEAKKAEAAKQKKEAEREKRRLAMETAGVDNVEDLRVMIRKRSLTTRETEEALLASGVLSGVQNEREAAARIVGRRGSLPTPSPGRKSSMPNFMHRIKAGFTDSLSKSVSKMRPGSSGSSVASSSFGGAKTRALREEFSGSTLKKTIARSRSRYSLPPSDDGSQSSVSRVSSRWRLKAMGIVTMPDGSVLPEYLADQIRFEGKRYPELGSFGMPPPDRPTAHHVIDTDEEVRPATMDGAVSRASNFRSLVSHKPHASVSAISNVDGVNPIKRKRTSADANVSDSEEGTEQDKSKRILLETEKTIREMRKLREEMEEGTGWFKEQNERLQSEMSSRPGTPWDQ